MNLDMQTVKCNVDRVVKRKQPLGLDLYDIYASVLSYHPKTNVAKQSKVLTPIACVTEKHMIPTKEGFKGVEELRVGDTIILELQLLNR